MKIGIFGDMHGNQVALNAALADMELRELDGMVCLGDALQGGSQPREVMETLKEIGCPVVLGNSDSWVLTGDLSAEAVESVSDAQREVREWTLQQLGSEGIEFIKTFLPTVELDLDEGRKLLCFHGSPYSFDHVLLPETPDDEFEQIMGSPSADVLAGGHTHLQWTRRLGDATFLNPGSAGVVYFRYLPMERFYFYPLSEYAVVESRGPHVTIEFCKVPFDVDELERVVRASGRPHSEREASGYRPR